MITDNGVEQVTATGCGIVMDSRCTGVTIISDLSKIIL